MVSIMTSAPAKFTFDVNMGRQREKTQTFTDDKLQVLLDAARRDGFEAGRVEGEKTELARTAQALLAAGDGLAQKAAQLLGSYDKMRKTTLGDAVALSHAVARKLATQLMIREPVAELEVLIVECMASLDKAPHLVVHCHPDIADAVRETAEKHINTAGFSGRLIIMGEPDTALGDGRIEWVDGGIVRDSTIISDQIDKAIAAYLSANGVEPVKETEQ